ncbi:peptidase M22 glycoprotease [Punctularia strigosozonata HHB-11173 SS5]|uniref:peptidase M22 glycoprotease n=1 Tax=Punctularia strigosozonata (strain HHB-11173) TaxID=741275 RepID=UPI0004416EF1|nr:peptidase M22 glycoprotease [Punctularia strigosozonata HHB-11173 SS5]EIN11412.1 peptidase M22 glycoprotease [Punctularia strigosozonata HHB-11173 SS5]
MLRAALGRAATRKLLKSGRCFALRDFTVLAIETSADDTCAAVVTSDRQILSNVVVKQHVVHEEYGGIYPMAAIDQHQRNLPGAVQRALSDARLTMADIDGVAFTRGPGMGGPLSVGSNAAKTLAAANSKPLVGVHHMQAHALTPLLTTPPDSPLYPTFPFLTFLLSGGHSLLLLCSSPTHFRVLATTVDKSLGGAFDHVARRLGLRWGTHGPGAELEKFAASPLPPGAEAAVAEVGKPKIPMKGQLAFSFTAPYSFVELYVERAGGEDNLTEAERWALARAFQGAAVQQVEDKLLMALQQCKSEGIEVRNVVASGGVASNGYLRQRLEACAKAFDPSGAISTLYPPPELCTDNAVMIAWAALSRFLDGDTDAYSIDLRRTWHIEELSGEKPVDEKYWYHKSGQPQSVPKAEL